MKYTFEDRKVVCKGDYWIAPDAIVIGSVILEPNASVWFGCIVRGDNDTITIGENSQLQDGCSCTRILASRSPSAGMPASATWRCCTAAPSATAA